MTALLLAFLGSLSAPGAALAHGAAHHREHQDAVASHAHAHVAHREHLHDQAAHRPPADAVEVRSAVAVETLPAPRTMAPNHEPEGPHGHLTLDLPVRPRVELAAILPLVAVATLLALPVVDVDTGTPVPQAALARPGPDAAAPPRTRAPPLR